MLLSGALSGARRRPRGELEDALGRIKYLVSWLMSVLFPLAALALGRALTEKAVEGHRRCRDRQLLYATFTTAKAPAAMLV